MYNNASNVPLTMAVWLAADYGYDLVYDPMTYSATDLLKPIKSLILSREIKNNTLPTETMDIADLAPSRLGTAVHTDVERAWLENYEEALTALGFPHRLIESIAINPEIADPDRTNIYIEQRTAKQMGKYTISGKFDFVIEGRVRDVKTTKTYNWIHGGNNHKYMMQGSIYRWLNPDIITDDFMSVDYAFTDWTPLQAQANKDYPPNRILSKDLELLPIQITEDFVNERLNLIDSLTGKPQNLMPDCTPEELWQNPTKWAFYRKATNKKATKLYDIAQEAYDANSAIGNTGVVVERPSTPKFCTYCDASSICLQADAFRAQGLL
jgi:hypothetical protein